MRRSRPCGPATAAGNRTLLLTVCDGLVRDFLSPGEKGDLVESIAKLQIAIGVIVLGLLDLSLSVYMYRDRYGR